MLAHGQHVSTLHWSEGKIGPHISYFKGKIVPGVSLEFSAVQGGYLKSKIKPLPYKNSFMNFQNIIQIFH